jgi:hypothetical protein
MNWLTTLISGGVDKIIDSTGKAIDSIVTSDQERLQLQNELVAIQLKAKQDAAELADNTEVALEKELTERLKADMTSDDVLSKKVRPLSLLYLLLVVTVLALTDGNLQWYTWSFHVGKEYIDLFKALLLMVFGFYYGSRGLEKIASIIWKEKK